MKKLSLILTFFIVTSSSPALTYDRIVTVGGDITEIVFALGKGEKVVATDTTAYSKEALKLPKVGYKRTLSTEGLLSLKPDLIIHSAGAGPESVIKQLQNLDVELLAVNDKNYSFEGILSKIKSIADKLGAEEKASEIISDLKNKKDDLNNMLSNSEENKKKSIFILTHAGPKGLVAGDKSSADALMELAGVKNIADKFKGFKPINPESMIDLNPDFIIASKASDSEKDETELMQKIKKLPGVSDTSAGQNDNIIFVETGRYLSFGPSTVDAAIELNKEVYESE